MEEERWLKKAEEGEHKETVVEDLKQIREVLQSFYFMEEERRLKKSEEGKHIKKYMRCPSYRLSSGF